MLQGREDAFVALFHCVVGQAYEHEAYSGRDVSLDRHFYGVDALQGSGVCLDEHSVLD